MITCEKLSIDKLTDFNQIIKVICILVLLVYYVFAQNEIKNE